MSTCILLCACLIAASLPLYAQQLAINRVDLMPDLPSPYLMRDWKAVARGYDALVFDRLRTGQYLPLVTLVPGMNYPSHQGFGLHTYVGSSNLEGINSLPALVGATLAGINKSNQSGMNWVLLAEDYFNNRPAEDVYLNHPDESSGDDWWYDTMPNVFFYELAWQYPGTGDFDRQFGLVADRWLQALRAMGGSITPWTIPNADHRAWRLSTMTPNNVGVHEPEAAGALAWLLYNAYARTGRTDYRMGAEWAMEFLNAYPSNPAYELQLPYGVYAAARMNAELGTMYDIQKMLNWCFDLSPLRTWGVTVGNWGGYDCSGLVGELGTSNYAFAMNSFEQVGALVPLVRYDERFARAIGKWVLNAANAARLFYPAFLPDQQQDNAAWSHTYDSSSTICYEALRQSWNGKQPYATGDAMSGGWAPTNLSLYSSSHVGILGGIIDTTNLQGVLRLNLLATDYYHQNAYPTYLLYNPHGADTTVQFSVGDGTHDLYELTGNSFLQRGVSGSVAVRLPANGALVIAVVPAGGLVTYVQDRMLVDGIVVDFHSGRTINNFPPRIKGLGAAPSTVPKGGQAQIYCTAADRDGDTLSYQWTGSGGSLVGTGPSVTWTAPDTTGIFSLHCTVMDNKGGMDSATVTINVIIAPLSVPQIFSIVARPAKVDLHGTSTITCSAVDTSGRPLTYAWSWNDSVRTTQDSTLQWSAPGVETDVTIRCTVDNGVGGRAADSTTVIVRNFSLARKGTMLAYYPMDGTTNDYSGNGRNGVGQVLAVAADRNGVAGGAYSFNGLNSVITVPNDSGLNCDSAITVAFWMSPGAFFNREEYPVSHGGWENRWKVSISPNHTLRWTTKTTAGVKDLDSHTLLQSNHWTFIVCSYDGREMELYIDGNLDAYVYWSGLLLASPVALTIGQYLPTNLNYGFLGSLDDMRIHNYALSVPEITGLYTGTVGVHEEPIAQMPVESEILGSYPNPFNPATMIDYTVGEEVSGRGGDGGRSVSVQLTVYDILGRAVKTLVNEPQAPGSYTVTFDGTGLASGVYICTLRTATRHSSLRLMLLK